jgi:hypothetical protein
VLISSQKYSFRFEQSATDDTISKEIFMKHNEPILIPAILFLILGGLGLLGHFGFLTVLSSPGWTAMFAVGGIGFLVWFARDQDQWWALIPASSLIGLALTFPIGEDWGDTVFLACIGLGFAAIATLKRDLWWAIIPAGTLLTLALITRLGDAGGTVLFIGLAATFAVVWQGSQRWAIYPTIGCLMMAALTADWLTGIWGIVWSLALIGFGAFLLMRPHQDGPHRDGTVRH